MTQNTAQKAVALLKEKALTVATAESCTGGLLSAAITAVSGASAVFPLGVAAYAAQAKHRVLQVSQQTLDSVGTISADTARDMANGARILANADIGIGITGVAGPETDEGKPVGCVYIALANETRVWMETLFPAHDGTRDGIRAAAVEQALTMLCRYAEAYPAMPAGSTALPQPANDTPRIPATPQTGSRRRFLATIFPWRGDTEKERFIKTVAWICTAAICIGSILGIRQLLFVSGNQSLYDDLQNMYVDNNQPAEGQSDILSRFNALYSQNPDIGGWIRIEGTNISYPVMKNAGSGYYATHNFKQQYSSYGVPFFDRKNVLTSAKDMNKALIIYGNNTNDGQMFSAITDYRQIPFFSEHAVVDMSTLYVSAKWQLFAVMVLDPQEINSFDYTKTDFENKAAFTAYVAEIRKRSVLTTNIQVDADDELLLMVTDAEKEYGFDNATMVVVGKKIREGETAKADLQVRRNPTVIMPRVWVRKNRVNTTTTKRTTATTATTASAVTTTTTVPTTQTVITTHETTTTSDTVTTTTETVSTVTTAPTE